MSNLRLNNSVQEGLRSLKNKYDEKVLGKDNAELFSNDIERLISDTPKGKWLTPDNWQRNLINLSDDAYNTMMRKDHRYGKALYELKDKWMDLIEKQVGSDLFKAANTAFSRSKIPEKAATYVKSIKAEGQVEPSELINAAKSELSTSRLASGENDIQQMAVEANKKYLADKAAIEGKHQAETRASDFANTEETRALQNKFTGMDQSLARQKAALQKQAEANVGKQEKAFESVVGAKNPEDYAARRLGYKYGLAPLLGGPGGLAYMGIDPLYAALPSVATIAGTRFLYNPIVQNWLKQRAISPRSAATKEMGETLKANAPMVGLAGVQSARQIPIYSGSNVTISNPDETENGLPVPKATGGQVKKKTHGPITKDELDLIHLLRESKS